MKKSVKPTPPRLPARGRRRAFTVPGEGELVRIGPPDPSCSLPRLVEPLVDGVDVVTWASDHRAELERHLLESGALLFRGFRVDSLPRFEELIAATSDRPAEYNEPATPRTQVSGGLYTSTDFPPTKRIFMHNENSNCSNWPLKIYFHCVVPSETGGETPVADSRRMVQQLDPALVRRFEERGVRYVRNFGTGVGLPWSTVFKTHDRAEVERYCQQNGITTEWQGEDRLRIQYRRHGVGHHPVTGDKVWFNHVALFHSSVIDEEARVGLLEELGEEGLPFNAFYGDGTPIGEAEVEEIYRVYEEEMVPVRWQRGDVLMIDNMLAAHGREPYTGERRVVVGMAEPFSEEEMARITTGNAPA
jgi:alpha-ketoglutarate-dependent taurine dioxygenase